MFVLGIEYFVSWNVSATLNFRVMTQWRSVVSVVTVATGKRQMLWQTQEKLLHLIHLHATI